MLHIRDKTEYNVDVLYGGAVRQKYRFEEQASVLDAV